MASSALHSGNGAWIEEFSVPIQTPTPAQPRTLEGFTVAVKDSYDIAGHKTGNGSPAWRDSHPAASATAPAVDKLIKAGAIIVGKCVMDEMAYSIEGQNYHYGTPLNPVGAERIPGGSSSGTASAVAQGLADFGLGGDTGGSVRVPASFCGLFGFRPTHGRVDISGSVPLASAFDTGGWMTRDAELLEKVGGVLLEGPSAPLPKPVRWLVGTEAFKMCSKEVASRIYEPLSAAMDGLGGVLSSPIETSVCGDGESLIDWFEVFRVCQAHEIWRTHGAWVQASERAFGPGIKERFEMASKITDEQFEAASRRRAAISARLDAMLDGSVLMIPTTSSEAPIKGLGVEELQQLRTTTLALTSIAGLGGLPQVTIPVSGADGAGGQAPVGLSLVGPRGSDEALLTLGTALAKVFR